MLLSVNWLENYVDIGTISPEELAERITKGGIEVDGIEYTAEGCTGVVTGYVKECKKHPDADKLNLCQVDVGVEVLQIICGAPNIAEGQVVAVAKPGARLPGNVKIKKAKLRGIVSNGMICSLQELGMKEKYVPKDMVDGIFVFPADVTPGQDVTRLLNMDDVILDLDLTPNRADCLSMLGIAYEVAAVLDKPLHLPVVPETLPNDDKKLAATVKIDDAALNPYYAAFTVTNVTVGPSPLWLRNDLMAAGIRPINNVVDITNFVLLEYGQPLHAFDYDALGTQTIVTRRAKDGETLVTLDNVERTLTNENLVITDGTKPIALAGVMGGLDTEVTDKTTTILLEAALFHDATVRKTVRQTGLSSEASTRYAKRGVDPNRVKEAGIRACQLLEEYAGGVVTGEPVVVDRRTNETISVTVDTATVNKRLGTVITHDEIASIFTKLRFNYTQQESTFIVEVPSRRADITIFEDMLEEVARIYGYDHLPFTLPSGTAKAGMLSKEQQLKRKIKRYLQSTGLMETITYSLTNQNLIDKLISPEIHHNLHPVELKMPMSEDHKYLRLSILPELLKTVAYNKARNQADIGYYELGSVFLSHEEQVTSQPNEQLRVSGALTGDWLDHEWQQEKRPVDFYLVKGIMEGLFNYLELPVTYQKATIRDMHPGRCAELVLGTEVIGFLGQVHPTFANEMDLDVTYVFDINLQAVFKAYQHVPTYKSIPKYPSITRDIAFILDQDVQAGHVKDAIMTLGEDLVKVVQIFDVYQGEHLPDGKKSVAYRLVYQNPERTLTDKEIDASYQTIVTNINEKFASYVRS